MLSAASSSNGFPNVHPTPPWRIAARRQTLPPPPRPPVTPPTTAQISAILKDVRKWIPVPSPDDAGIENDDTTQTQQSAGDSSVAPAVHFQNIYLTVLSAMTL